jgi:hypothetical protein
VGRAPARGCGAAPARGRGDVEIVPDDDDHTFARQVGRKYGGTDLSYADRPGESRVGVVLHPVRVNVTDLRPPPGG